MTARIFFKLLSAVLIIIIVALTAIDFLGSRRAEKAYIDSLKREMSDKTRMLSVLSEQQLVGMDDATVRALASAAEGRLTVIAPDGRVIIDSEANPRRMENHLNRPEVQAAIRGEVGYAIRRSGTVGINFLYVALPVNAGVARLAVPLQRIDTEISQLRIKLVGYTALAFLPAILLAAFFARYFSRRLGAIIDYASKLAAGDFGARLECAGNDELSILGRQLNETGENLGRMFLELQREHVELERVERIRTDFVINVSHELRTPLASIQGYTETLLDGAIHDRENNLRFLNIIRQNAERLGRLTADLLTLSRLELKTQRLQFASYYIRPLLGDCIDSLRPVADKKNISIHLDQQDDRTEVFCDSESVHQIMSNLLDNAVKYTPAGGSIKVTARVAPKVHGLPEMAEITVSDTGIGIPAEDLPRLFERFYRVDKARSRELGGTGLGLAIVKHLVRAQGGEVRVESFPGKGSTFTFTLPTQDLGLAEHASVQAELTAS